MHLKSLTLKGFKSFPDRTKLDFASGVSVVVGPNGSGKSNVTDAVLWAMGEQSPLAVRGQSMQDVIFGGGKGVQARSAAEVELVLDNADGAVDLPLGEISILRRLDRSGEGEYRLNGARCRLVDILEILSDTGLGKESHSVVSQGRVEAIVTSKPRDRRLLIEEAAGLGKHRKRRRRAQLKLERTQDNLDRALDVEREARARLRPLKRQAEAAELHVRLERQTDEARWTLAGEDARAAREELAGGAAGRGGGRGGARGPRARSWRAPPRPRAQRARPTRRSRPSSQSCGRRASGRRPRWRRGRASARRSPTAPIPRAPRRSGSACGGRPRPRRARRSRTARSAAAPCSRGSRPRRPTTRGTTPAPPIASPAWRPSSSSSPRTATSGSPATSRRSRRAGRRPRPSARGSARSPARRSNAAARRTPRPTPRAAHAGRSRPVSSGLAATPPRSGRSLLRSTSSCARMRARRAERRRSPTPCAPSRATSSRSRRRWGRGCGRRWRRIWARLPACSTARAAMAGPRWWLRNRPSRQTAPPLRPHPPRRPPPAQSGCSPTSRRRRVGPRGRSLARCSATSGWSRT